MATNEKLKNQLQEGNKNKIVPANQLGFKSLMQTDAMKKKFNDILHEKSDAFMGSLMTLVGGDNYLSEAEPMTIIASALKSATMDLPIDKNLGYAYIVPFNRKEKKGNEWITHNEAQFILGYKGYIQLAQRSGQYKSLNAITVYEGQIDSWNPLTEEFIYNYNSKESEKVIGYVGYFELLNGFTKTVFWSKEEIEHHRIKNAKGYNPEKLTGAWKDNYDAMAIKTVLRNMLAKWGILSVELQTAVSSDEKVYRLDDEKNVIEEPLLKDAEPVEEEKKEPNVSPERKEIKDQDKKEVDQKNIFEDDDLPF